MFWLRNVGQGGRRLIGPASREQSQRDQSYHIDIWRRAEEEASRDGRNGRERQRKNSE